jgi:hypothetical protein
MMAEATKRLTAGTSAHGNAGEASIFLVLGDRKLKEGGSLALVMPLSLMVGESWEDSRLLLRRRYSDIIVLSIAGAGSEDMSFSADTGMAECLVVGKKSNAGNGRATFVILNERPPYPLFGAGAAKQIHRLIATKSIRKLEDGPLGGSVLYFGDDVIGQAMDAPLPEAGGWNLGRIADLSLAQTAFQITHKACLWLPAMKAADAQTISITTIGKISTIGPIHRDINGTNANGTIRGPMDVKAVSGGVPTYPVLWSHEAERERTMMFDEDCEGVPRVGANPTEDASILAKLESVWASASHCHFNCDFQFNSQSTGMQFTPRKSIGGRAWLSVRMKSAKLEKALVLWSNTSLGILLRWWHSNKQQSGRGNIGKTALQSMPVFDVSSLAPRQLDKAADLFDSLCLQLLSPIHEIDKDPIRKELDERFCREVLNLPESIMAPGGSLELLRMKLAREPSIRGSK